MNHPSKSPAIRLALLFPLLVTPLLAEPFLWDGDCLNHPQALSNRWHVQCQILVGPDMDTNWNTDRLPDWDADISVPPGIAGGTRITTSFATRANTIECLSPLLVNGGGPIFINDPSQPSVFGDLDLERGQINVRSTLTFSGTTRIHRGVLIDFSDDPDGGTMIVEGDLTIEGVAPDPFANTLIDPRHLINRGNVTQTGDYSVFSSTFTNESTWTIAPGEANFGGGTFINTEDATLTKNGTELVTMFSRLENHGDVNLTAGTLKLTAADNLLASGTIDVIPGADLILATGFPDFGVPHASLNFTGGSLFATGPVEANPDTGIKIEPGASVTTSGPDAKSTIPVISNSGTITHNAGNWQTGGMINQPDATLTIDGSDAEFGNNLRPLRNLGTIQLNDGTLTTSFAAPLDNQATITWSGGKIESAKITNQQAIDINPGDVAPAFVGSELDDNGTTTLHPGSTLLFGTHSNGFTTARWTITPTGTLAIQNNGIEPHPNGIGTSFITSTGTITKSGNQTATINVPLKIDGGTTNAVAGTLALNHGSTHNNTASLGADSGATLRFSGIGHHFAGNHTVTGDGFFELGTPATPTTVLVQSGKLHFDNSAGTNTNHSTLTIDSDGEIELSSDLTNRSNIEFKTGTLTSTNDSILANWADEGTIKFFGDHRYEISSRIDNSATLEVLEKATVVVPASAVLQFDPDERRLSGGRWIFRDAGTLQMPGVSIRHNNAFVEYHGINSRSHGLNLSGVNLVNDPGATIRLIDGSELDLNSFNGFFENNGTLFVDATSKVIVREQFETNTGSTTTILGELTADDFDNDGGSFSGSGTINAQNFNNNGDLNPGASPGILNLNSNFDQPASGSLTIELAGTTPGATHDQLAVTGTATLAGTLNITLLDGFQPTLGQSFTILTAAAVSGQFTTVNIDAGGAGTHFTVAYDATTVRLTASSGQSGTSYNTWRTTNFSPADQANDAISGPTANPDQDTLENLLEFAFNLDPNSPSPSPVTVTRDPASGALHLRFPWTNNTTGLTHTFSTTPDLESWLPATATLIDSQPDGPKTWLTYRVDTAAAAHFARLEVTLAP